MFTYGIVLIFSPLPGYLLLKSSPLTLRFWLGLSFLWSSHLCVFIVFYYFGQRQKSFFYQRMGKSKTKLHLLKVLLPLSWIYFVLLFAAFLQVDFQWKLQFLVYLLTGVGLFLGVYFYLLEQKLKSRRCTPIFGKHVGYYGFCIKAVGASGWYYSRFACIYLSESSGVGYQFPADFVLSEYLLLLEHNKNTEA